MVNQFRLGILGLFGAVQTLAAVPPAEQLLPADIWWMITAPDWSQGQAAFEASPQGQLWQDPALKPFKDQVLTNWQARIVQPLERQLGLKLTDYLGLLRGQVTFTITRLNWESDKEPSPDWLLLIDARDRSEQLKTSLDGLRKKWVEAGKTIKSTKIRNLDFTTLVFTGKDLTQTLRHAFPALAAEESEKDSENAAQKHELTMGQSESLLLLGNNAKDLEKILVRQAGGQMRALVEEPEFRARQALFRQSLAFTWLNASPIMSMLGKKLSESSVNETAANPMAPKPDKLLGALGLEGLKSLAASLSQAPEGNYLNVFVSVPETQRKGLFKVFTLEPKNTEPPAFVPADALSFNRWRVDGQKAWNTIKTALAELSPQISGLLQMGLAAAGKDKDPNFDLEKSLIGNLGDDFLTYQKPPRRLTMADLDSPPALVLIGARDSEKLVQALRTGAALLIPPTTPIKEREFRGRKILTLPNLGGSEGEEEDAGGHQLHISTTSGYVAFSADEALLEEYLRSGESPPKALADNQALKEASQKVGGMNTGVFGYENDKESLRMFLEVAKREQALLTTKPAPTSNPDKSPADAKIVLDLEAPWFQFSLLPPFEKLEKYFYFSVFAASTSTEGLAFKTFFPNPPGLKSGQ